MGIYSHGELIYGIPIQAFDNETGEPTMWWDKDRYGEDEGDWIEFEDQYLKDNLEIKPYGHYEDYENKAILSSPRIDAFVGDCWDPTPISEFDLKVADKALSKGTDALRVLGSDLSFYGDAQWNLVASVG